MKNKEKLIKRDEKLNEREKLQDNFTKQNNG